MTGRPTLLLVEDDDSVRARLSRKLSAPPREFVEAYGVGGFVVHEAATGAEGRQRLNHAAAKKAPYDVLLLDIGLPEAPGGAESPLVGRGILKSINERMCAAVVVESVHTEVPTFLDVLRAKAADFVPKDRADTENFVEDVFRAVAQAYKACLESRWLELSALRSEEWRLIQARGQVADLMAQAATEGIDLIRDRVNALTRLVEDRFQLDCKSDTTNPICGSIGAIRRAVEDAADRCKNARKGLSPGAGRFECVAVEDLIKPVVEHLSVGFDLSRLAYEGPTQGEHGVHTFPDALEKIFEEMIFGALEAARGEMKRSQIETKEDALKVSVSRNEGKKSVDITVSDRGPAIKGSLPEDERPLDPAAGRIWGLSLAQSVARNIGASIEIERPTTGNRVTLHIPLTADD